jgi:calcium-translocating P-type ATPase
MAVEAERQSALALEPAGASSPAAAPFAAPAQAVVAELGSDVVAGLSSSAAADRRSFYGPNRPSRAERPPYFSIAVRQVADPLVALLVAAVVVSAAIGEQLDAAIIGAIVVLNALLGFAQEAGAEREVLALREVVERHVAVVRDGQEVEVSTEDIVPGDLIVLREGDAVAADARLVAARGLEVDESTLTGESVPVAKSGDPVAAQVPFAERSSMVFAGTGITRGRARAVVTATGDATEIGTVAELTARAKPPRTPFQRRLGELARVMVVLGIGITLFLGGAMLARGSALHEAFLVGVSVAVAAVPEGLVATLTVALALGGRAMARRGAIVRRLRAVETLGGATVIASDKTGTLTQNRLRLAAVWPLPGEDEERVLAAAVLASTAEIVDRREGPAAVGDPVEGALLLAAREQGLDPGDLVADGSVLAEIPFDPERRRAAVAYSDGQCMRVFAKGAPEVISNLSSASSATREALEEQARAWAADGLRVLAIAERFLADRGPADNEELDSELRLLGLVALHDPLRPQAAGAVRDALEAGVDVRILTGDHPATADAIGRELRLSSDAVFARVSPADKLELVRRLQRSGEVVVVTGDGVNDAPALRQADVGIAMGRSGTEAAREAADIVLTDDDFSTIVAAVREGRRVGDNVRKFVAFLLSANLGEVLLFAAAVGAGLGVPLTVIQVLIINVLTDGLPAVALSRDPEATEAMARGPFRGGRLFSRRVWGGLAVLGVLVGLVGLAAFLAGRALGDGAAQTMAFATIAAAELTLVFSVRSVRRPPWRLPRNGYLEAAVLASVALLVASIYLPALHEPLGTVSLGLVEVAIVAVLAAAPVVLVELVKAGAPLMGGGCGKSARRFGGDADGGSAPPAHTERS